MYTDVFQKFQNGTNVIGRFFGDEKQEETTTSSGDDHVAVLQTSHSGQSRTLIRRERSVIDERIDPRQGRRTDLKGRTLTMETGRKGRLRKKARPEVLRAQITVVAAEIERGDRVDARSSRFQLMVRAVDRQRRGRRMGERRRRNFVFGRMRRGSAAVRFDQNDDDQNDQNEEENDGDGDDDQRANEGRGLLIVRIRSDRRRELHHGFVQTLFDDLTRESQRTAPMTVAKRP